MGVAHPRFHTPHVAIVAQTIWASALVAIVSIRDLFSSVVYTEFFFFALMTVGLARIQRRWSFAGIVFVIGCVAVIGNQFAADIVKSSIGMLIVATGVPFYLFLKSRNKDANHRLS
jgi:APA family basic amino acid/polyamine antiporter